MSDTPWFLIVPTGPKGLAMWIVPILYVIACLVVRSRRRARQAAMQAQAVDGFHQFIPSVLIAGLKQRENANSDTDQGVYPAASAGLIDLVFTGGVRCTGAPERPAQPFVAEEPVREGGLIAEIRRGREAKQDALESFGADIIVERTDAVAAPLNEAAFSVINPTGESSISIAQMYHVFAIASRAFSKNIKTFKRLMRDTLSESGLLELPTPAERLLRGPLVHVLQVWCLVMMFAAGVSGIIAFILTMVFAAFFLKSSGLLTPTGAAALERAHDDMRAAQQMVQAGIVNAHTSAADAQRMLCSTVALEEMGLACDFFALIDQAGVTHAWQPDVRDSLASLLVRHPYGGEVGDKQVAPLELVVAKIENDFYHIEN